MKFICYLSKEYVKFFYIIQALTISLAACIADIYEFKVVYRRGPIILISNFTLENFSTHVLSS